MLRRAATAAGVLCGGGLVCEGAAAPALLHGYLAHALLLHGAAALVFGFMAGRTQQPFCRSALFVATSLVFTLPVLGALGVFAIVLPAWRARRDAQPDTIIEVGALEPKPCENPREMSAPLEVVLRYGEGTEERVAAVMALRRMDAQHAVPLLRVALLDAQEDVRLLAYAMLERREKDLRGQIESALSELAQLPTSGHTPLRAATLRRLTEQHWELVYGGFVSGDLRVHTLNLALQHGRASLLLQPDGSLAVLLARLCLHMGAAHHGLRYLRAAAALGTSNAALAPLYAEVAFLLRRFHAIAPLLAQAGEVAWSRPRLAAVAQFWQQGRLV